MITDYFPPHVGGGTEKAVYEISKRLVMKGHEVFVVTLNGVNAPRHEYLNGIEVFRCSCVDLTEIIKAQLTISPTVYLDMLRIWRKREPDIIHAHNLFFFTTACTSLFKPMFRRPLVTTMHLGPVQLKGIIGPLARAYERIVGRWLVKSSDAIIAVSDAVGEHAINLGAPPEKVVVIPNGVDLDPMAAPREGGTSDDYRGARPKRVVFVGRLIFNKGVQYLVEAAPRIVKDFPDVEFVVVGDGPLKSKLMKRTEELGVQRHFSFLGIVPCVTDVLSKCDIFVRPSLTEGMSLAALEAMGCGLPVILTALPGTESVEKNSAGILIRPDDTQELADAVIWLLGDTECARRLGMNARLLAERHYSWDRVAESTIRVYQEILCNTR